MTKIKLCGLSRVCDINVVNTLKPEYIGFVFAQKSKRYIPAEYALELKKQLDCNIKTVGVFVNENPEFIAKLLKSNVIDLAQLHGHESENDIVQLRILTNRPIIKAFQIESEKDIEAANKSSADFVLLDSKNGGSGVVFDWNLLQKISRPYFLAGGLTIENVNRAVKTFRPYAVDVSSGIETNGCKDKHKMTAFVCAVRKEENL